MATISDPGGPTGERSRKFVYQQMHKPAAALECVSSFCASDEEALFGLT